jgi:hypothetical protein
MTTTPRWQRTIDITDGRNAINRVPMPIADRLARMFALAKGPRYGTWGPEAYVAPDEATFALVTSECTRLAQARRRSMARRYSIELRPVDGHMLPAENPEGTEKMVCLLCGNRTAWYGIDERVVASQHFGTDEEGENEDYDSYDSEIGSYTEIHCAVCETVLWRLPRPTQEDVRTLRALLDRLAPVNDLDVRKLALDMELVLERVAQWLDLEVPPTKLK